MAWILLTLKDWVQKTLKRRAKVTAYYESKERGVLRTYDGASGGIDAGAAGVAGGVEESGLVFGTHGRELVRAAAVRRAGRRRQPDERFW